MAWDEWWMEMDCKRRDVGTALNSGVVRPGFVIDDSWRTA